MNIKPTNISEEEKTRIFEESLKNQTPYVEKEPVKIQLVKHGRWIGIYEYYKKKGCFPSGLGFWCSECYKSEKKTSDFCPNCGAKMDGAVE